MASSSSDDARVLAGGFLEGGVEHAVLACEGPRSYSRVVVHLYQTCPHKHKLL